MNCSKCGHEFEGKFCPNCGEPADGSKAQNAPIGAAKVPAVVGKLYAHMPKIFSMLFAVFAVLMLICYAGGVSKSELAEEFGGTPDSVYSYLSGNGEESEGSWEEKFAMSAEEDFDFGEESGSGVSLESLCAALVAFGALAAVVAALGLAFALYVPLRATKFKVGDRTFKAKSIVDIASLVVLFVIFLLGCILCANVGDELGLSEPGAAPICIIFFSLLFGLLMIAALFGRKLISLVWKGAKDEYEAQREAVRESVAEPLEPICDIPPRPILQPTAKISEPEKDNIVKFVKKRDKLAYITNLPLTLVVGSAIALRKCSHLKTEDHWKLNCSSATKWAIFMSLLLLLGGIGILIPFIINAISLIYHVIDYNSMSVPTEGYMPYDPRESTLQIIEIYKAEMQSMIFSSLILGLVIAIIGLVLLILNGKNLTKTKKLTKQYYGAKRVKKCPNYPQYTEQYKQYKEAKREFKKDVSKYRVDKAYYEEGIAQKRRA